MPAACGVVKLLASSPVPVRSWIGVQEMLELLHHVHGI
jgi:hypothetical protein